MKTRFGPECCWRVVWAREVDDTSNDWQVMARRFTPDGFGDEVIIDEDGYAPSARIALRSDGSALALWASLGLSGAIAIDGAFGPSLRRLESLDCRRRLALLLHP